MPHPRMEKLLNPRSLAFVGANDKGNSCTRAMRTAVALGFSGPIFPVNPNYDSIDGLRCYPSLLDLPERPDSVMVGAPARSAMDVLTQAEQAGVGAITFYSAGFSDAGNPAGIARQAQLLSVAERSGMLVAGPNCMGALSFQRGFGGSFASLPGRIKVGGISIVSQSGGLINAFMELGYARDLAFNYLISAGNEAVVHTADYLDWLADDDATKVIISCLESVKNGSAYLDALTKATARKPVVILKLGRSEAGQQATQAHTGALAASDEVFSTVCLSAGAVLVNSIDEALEVAAMFERMPLPDGDGVVIFSTSGGATALTTDIADRIGLACQPLQPQTNERLQNIYAAPRPFTNPFDVGSYPLMARGDNMTKTLQTLAEDDTVHMIACVMVVQRDMKGNRAGVYDQVRSFMAHSQKPFAIIPEATLHWREVPPDLGSHVASSLEEGLNGLRALRDYAGFRRRLATRKQIAPGRTISIARRRGRFALTEYESKKMLADAGLPVTHERLARTVEEALSAAQCIGYPVALKIQSPSLMHKSDAGGVILNIEDAASLQTAFRRMLESAAVTSASEVDGVLVQEMVSDAVEILVGMKRDPTFGPVVALSPGGVLADLLGDAARLELAPFDEEVADELVASAPVVERLLAGFRGRPKADRAALVSLLARFSQFAASIDQAAIAIDLNPVGVLPEGRGVRIMDATIELRAEDD